MTEPMTEEQMRLKALDLAVYNRSGALGLATATEILTYAERFLAWMKGDAPPVDLRVKDGGQPMLLGEPSFTLRGKDRTAWAALETYIAKLEDEGRAESDVANEVRKIAKAFDHWAKAHPDLMADPD